MTLGEMVTEVRQLVRDPNATYWTSVQIRTKLNRAAAQVAREISRFQRINYEAGSETFTTTNNDQTYALSATTVRKIWRMTRTDCSPAQPCEEIRDLDQHDLNTNYWQGKWRFFVTRSASTGVFTINFPFYAVQAGMTFTVEYVARPTALATDGTADSSSFTIIDDDYHDLVCAQAAADMLGPDSSLYGACAARLGDLRMEMQRDLQTASNSPDRIKQEFF